jgi:hypothetical protein
VGDDFTSRERRVQASRILKRSASLFMHRHNASKDTLSYTKFSCDNAPLMEKTLIYFDIDELVFLGLNEYLVQFLLILAADSKNLNV